MWAEAENVANSSLNFVMYFKNYLLNALQPQNLFYGSERNRVNEGQTFC